MQNNKHLKWFVSLLVSLYCFIIPVKSIAASDNVNKISHITKTTPLILQHASAAIPNDLIHGSHVSHASHFSHVSHASHASHFSHYSSS